MPLSATSDKARALQNPDFVIVATPTDYDPDKKFFNTESIESVIADVARCAPQTTVVIKSTVPIGFTVRMRRAHPALSIIFSPEFLREGQALYDNLHPSRIIVGDAVDAGKAAQTFASLLLQGVRKKDVPVLYMPPTEAEAVKLFANTYLALRVSYFNELDTFAELRGLDAKSIIDGVCRDPRVGAYYNNPSFGYGGYCLPKDAKQMLANYEGVPNNIIEAIVAANETRKTHIAAMILSQKPRVAGIYKLGMKTDSDNARSSAILNIIERLKEAAVDVVIFDPSIREETMCGCPLVQDFDDFAEKSDVIIANRMSEELAPHSGKVYTRDVFQNN
jgi:UDPglucose 6-dehydrogenase